MATHQVQLAAGLVAAGVSATLLATNARANPGAWRVVDEAPFPLYRMARPAWGSRHYRTAVGHAAVLRYALRLAFSRPDGSRREILENLLWYRRFLRSVAPDVIHVQHPLERCLYARTVRRLDRWTIPLVVTAHSLSGEHPVEVIETLMAPNLVAADRVIAVSPHIARETIALGVEPSRVRVIRSGVDPEQFRPRDAGPARAALGIGSDTPLVLFVGNLEPRKQVDVLLRAMARVHEQLAEAKLIVVGSGESAGVQDQTASLLRLTGELDLGGVVSFVGRTDDRRLQDWYASADVFVLPSSSEAQGIVALEAMASGLPVIATAVGGLRDTIVDGQTGILVPPGDAGALAEPLVMLLRNPACRQAIGARARQAVERDFAWPAAVRATLEVYRDASRAGE